MRTFLPLLVHAGTVMLLKGRGRAQPAVGVDTQHTQTAPRIIGRQDVLALLVHHEVARSGATGRLLIQQSQVSGLGIDSERTDRPAAFSLKVIEFSYCVKETMVRMKGKKRRIFRFGGQSPMRKLTRNRVKFKSIDSFAV